jgi:hypothetical protein
MGRLDLTEIDVDGALRETAAAVADGHTRAGFLRRAGLAGGALAGAGAVFGAFAPGAMASESGGPPAAYGPGDIGILNFALALEYLESTFYNRATSHWDITDPATLAFLKTTTRDENAHVAALEQALGSSAIAKPKFKFDHIPNNQSAFQKTAYVLENTGVHAYLGQLTNISSPGYLAAAGSIALIEGRHAAVIGSIINDTPSGIAPNGPFDTPQTAEQVIGEVNATGFVVGGLPS